MGESCMGGSDPDLMVCPHLTLLSGILHKLCLDVARDVYVSGFGMLSAENNQTGKTGFIIRRMSLRKQIPMLKHLLKDMKNPVQKYLPWI